MYWAGLPATAVGLRYSGLIHAADWLPTIYSAVGLGSAVPAGSTLPLDGVDMWGALISNATSPRTDVYYGISQAGNGPVTTPTFLPPTSLFSLTRGLLVGIGRHPICVLSKVNLINYFNPKLILIKAVLGVSGVPPSVSS